MVEPAARRHAPVFGGGPVNRDRYDRYADEFGNPVTAESIELGNRAPHWTFMENWSISTGRGVIAQHAREAQRQAAGQ